jgi:RTA1 like protein
MASISVFVLLFIEFLRRVGQQHKTLGMRVKILIGATAVSCSLIYVRSIYRTVELLQGWSGYLITHEGYFIGLDAVTMLLAVAVFNFIHPGWCLPDSSKLTKVDASIESMQNEVESEK